LENWEDGLSCRKGDTLARCRLSWLHQWFLLGLCRNQTRGHLGWEPGSPRL